MPSDYSSTARSLALPLSPPQSPDLADTPTHPPWPRSSSMMSHSRHNSYESGTFTQRLLQRAAKLQRRGMRLYQKMTLLQKTIFICLGLLSLTLTILFLVYNHAIFAWLEPKAEAWREMSGGWAILWALTFATAFPPLFGYSTCVTIAGFVYGVWPGWPIVATANVAGSFLSFLLFRNLLSKWATRLVNSDPRFAALTLVLKHDGLKLLCMIRLCPLPYSFSNGAMSTFQTVSPANFAIATAAATPKLFIHVFIGGRLAELAKSGEGMDAGTKLINWASIIFGGALGIGVGYWVYKRTEARAKQLEVEEQAKLMPEGRRSGVRQGSQGLEHPDAFMDDIEEGDEWDSLSPQRGGNDDIDFLGDDHDVDGEPYSDEPSHSARGSQDEEMGHGKIER